MIRITYAHLCDYAHYSADRKPNLLGLFSRIYATAVPAIHPQAFLAFGMQIPPNYDVKKPIAMRIEGSGTAKEKLFVINALTTLTKTGTPGDLPPVIHQILQLPALTLNQYGVYAVRIFLGASARASSSVAFELSETPTAQSTGAKKTSA